MAHAFSLTHEQGKSLIRKTNPPNAISIPINSPKVPPTSFSAESAGLFVFFNPYPKYATPDSKIF